MSKQQMPVPFPADQWTDEDTDRVMLIVTSTIWTKIKTQVNKSLSRYRRGDKRNAEQILHESLFSDGIESCFEEIEKLAVSSMQRKPMPTFEPLER